MHVMPRRCKLLLKPYFLFGRKRQKQNCTNHWRTSCSLKKKKKVVYTKHGAIIYVVMRVYHFYFSKSRSTNQVPYNLSGYRVWQDSILWVCAERAAPVSKPCTGSYHTTHCGKGHGAARSLT